MTIWTFEEAQEYLDKTAPPGKSIYGLGRISHLLDLLGHPEKDFICITIAGTNGKGSTLAFLDSLLREHGITVACHVKPHLESVTERIRLHGNDSTEKEFASALFEVKQAVEAGWSREDDPTYFELIFAVFLCAARKAGVRVVILEAGLGGRLDAVNAVDADLVILASIDFDHTELLGNTLEEITMEKIVIARMGSTVVCQKNPEVVIKTVKEFCGETGVRLVVAENCTFLDDMELGLKGPYQHMNACLAFQALEALAEIHPELFIKGSSYKFFEKGFREARLPGRWEELTDGRTGRKYILDGGHNRAGLESVMNHYRDLYENKGGGTIIFALKKSKDVDSVLPMLAHSAKNIILTKLAWPESHSPDEMALDLERMRSIDTKSSQINVYKADSIRKGIEIANNIGESDIPVLVTGSLYLVGEARSEIMSGI